MLGLAVISSVMLSFGYSGWRLLFGGVVVWGIGDGWYNDGEVVMMMETNYRVEWHHTTAIRSSSPRIK